MPKRKEIAVAVTMEQIKELREKTGVGIMDCKKALNECGKRE